MSFEVKVYPSGSYAAEAAKLISERLDASGSLVVTGGTTAKAIYSGLDADLSGVDVYFSDERCVPPDHESSNFRMANDALLERCGATKVHRMRGEDPPRDAADAYHNELAPAVREGFGLMLLGMGGDNHIAALFPNSPALLEPDELCVPVDRPDGLKGLTMTPTAIVAARSVVIVVAGSAKSGSVARAFDVGENEMSCPVRLLADHPNVTFVLDEPAAERLDR